jgi:hypothetical protein
MSCTTLITQPIEKSCENNSGGILRAWVIDQDNFTGKTVVDADWEVTAITNDEPFVPIDFRRNTSNYEEVGTIDLVNGSTFYQNTINFMFHRREAAKSRALKILGEGQRYLTFVIEDANGIFWLFEYMQMNAAGDGSGTARADGSKYSISFTGEANNFAYVVDSAIIPNLESINS